MKANVLSILIPVYNERDTLMTLLEQVEAVDFCGLEKDIILVDDGSTDGTRELLRSHEEQENHYKIYFTARIWGKGQRFEPPLTTPMATLL